MGCEIELLPDKLEKDHSCVQNPYVSEGFIERGYPHSISCVSSLKSVSRQCGYISNGKKTFKMTSSNNMSDCKSRQGSVREPVESTDETIHNLDKTSETGEADINENVPNESNDQNGGTDVLCHDSANTDNNSGEEVADTPVQACNNIDRANARGEQSVNYNNETKHTGECKPGPSTSVEISPGTSTDDNAPSSGPLSDQNLQLQILNRLEELKDKLETCTDIPPILFDVSLNCLKPSTIEYMSYHLDPEMEVLSTDHKLKDYRGMAEWIGLENIFIKYISRSSFMLKTREVLSKWLTKEDEPLPNLKNLRECLLSIEREDVLEDLSIKIGRDAVSWKMTQFEARSAKKKPRNEDTSWQLTRHDVVTGKETFYTCCLVYADEDEGMAQIFMKLYKTVYPDALFFLPQFDLKQGKFLYETTAQVIEERCEGKVIFIISEYFFASSVCRFTVHFCKDMESSTEQGNLIPFNLTSKYEHVPRVLRGIAGIRWFRKSSRKHLWLMLTDSLLGGKMTEIELEELKERMNNIIDRDSEYYLSDPPYDDDTPQPGDPISVYDPPPEVENSDDPSARHFNPGEDECLMSQSLSSLEAMGYVRRRSNFARVRHYVRKKIIRRLFGSGRQRRRAPLPSTAHQPPIELPR